MSELLKNQVNHWEKTLKNKVVVISGASSGLGKNLSNYFYSLDSKLSLFSRNISNSLIKENRFKKNNVFFDDVDITNFNNVKKFIDATINKFGKIDCLINCAGIYGPMGNFESISPEDFAESINVNLIGSFNTIYSCLPNFKENKYGRIVQLSGGGATSPLPYIYGYASSKAAVVRMIESLAIELDELKGFDIKINAVAPGALNTQMLDKVIQAGEVKVGKDFYKKALKQKVNGGASIQNASECIAFLSSSLNTKISSKLISAVWDPWRDWTDPGFPTEEIPKINDNLFTLRRIV